MDIANLTQQTNGNFLYTFILDAWADLFDFADGIFHAQMRKDVASPLAYYEWSTANGRATYDQTLANGSIAFTINPTAGQTITLGSTIVTFVASGATGNQVNIDVALSGTLTALKAKLNASLDTQISKCTYDVSSNTLSIIYKTAGTLGNSFAIASAVSGTTVSADTLGGGGGAVTLTAPVLDIEDFSGDYFYDCRFQIPDDDIFVPIFGGTITFVEGVTRDTQD